MKKVVFFDGDGTLWYPSRTKRSVKPHWVYHDVETKDNYLEYLELTPGAKDILEVLRQNGIYAIVVSASPNDTEVAESELKDKISHFGLDKLIHAYKASDGADPDGKASVLLRTLKDLKLNEGDALMVGDSYYYDYLAAKSVGIDALFINNAVAELPSPMPDDLSSIDELNEVQSYLKI